MFKSNPVICHSCPCLRVCTNSKNYHNVVQKYIWEDYIEQAEDFRHSPREKETYAMRGQTIERVLADAKEKYGMRYTLQKGIERVTHWLKLKFAAMNLKKLAMWASHEAFSTFVV